MKYIHDLKKLLNANSMQNVQSVAGSNKFRRNQAPPKLCQAALVLLHAVATAVALTEGQHAFHAEVLPRPTRRKQVEEALVAKAKQTKNLRMHN